jgi:hypothetical protein
MSVSQPPKPKFDLNKQRVGIPSYLIAIASGNLHYRPFPAIEGRSWKSGVWAEPESLDACYWEFSEDTGRSPSGLIHLSAQLKLYPWPDSSLRKRILWVPTNLEFMMSWSFHHPSHMGVW